MILFFVFWTTSLVIVYRKIKATGRTAPNSSIFISHILLISIFILTQIIANILPLFAHSQNTEEFDSIYCAIYILLGVSNTSESLIFILVFYLLIKRGGKLQNSCGHLLINVNTTEDLIRDVQDTENDETVENLRECFDRTLSSRSLILNCIDQNLMAFRGCFELDFNRRTADNNTLSESIYEESPNTIKSSKLTLPSSFSSTTESQRNQSKSEESFNVL